MAIINIASVQAGSKSYTAHIVLTENPIVDGDTNIVVLGEAFVEIPAGTEMPDAKKRIVDAAKGIMKKHKDSADKRRDLEELDFPPID